MYGHPDGWLWVYKNQIGGWRIGCRLVCD